MKHQTTTLLLLLCAALLTGCGSSMNSRMEKWGWTDKAADPGPRFGDHTPPATPGLQGQLTVTQGGSPAGVSGIAPKTGSQIGTATSALPAGAIPPPPVQSQTPEFNVPAAPKN